MLLYEYMLRVRKGVNAGVYKKNQSLVYIDAMLGYKCVRLVADFHAAYISIKTFYTNIYN